jgi:hypothetical protein
VLVRDYGPTLVFGPSLVMAEEQVARATSALVDVLSRRSVRSGVSRSS